jgi:hypothetical protein
MSKRPGSQSPRASVKLPRLDETNPRAVFDSVKSEAYDNVTEYEVDRHARYEEEHTPSDAVLVPAFVQCIVGTAGAASLRQDLLWRWEPGVHLIVFDTFVRMRCFTPQGARWSLW